MCYPFIKKWPVGVIFEADLSNSPNRKHRLHNNQSYNWYTKCHGNKTFRFQNPTKDVFIIQPKSAALNFKPAKLILRKGDDWPGEIDWPIDTDIVGALDSHGKPIDGPPFVFYRPDVSQKWYDERPRVVRVERDNEKQLIIHFSVPLATSCPIDICLSDPDSTEPPKNGSAKIEDGTRIEINLDENWDGPAVSNCKIHLPRDIRSKSGQSVTLWASTDDNLVFLDKNSN